VVIVFCIIGGAELAVQVNMTVGVLARPAAPRFEEREVKDRGSEEIAPIDCSPGRETFLADVLAGLCKPQKELPSKYFYDERGAALFERICDLEEYYIPRVEASIMHAHIGEMAGLIGSHALLMEYGSGNCEKVRVLLDHLYDPVAYLPVDISRVQLLSVAEQLASEYPELEIYPICADYLARFDVPEARRHPERRCVYFPGSTIGNLDPVPAQRFLKRVAGTCGQGGALLIGVDLKKDPSVLHRAYNDRDGLTAEFNLNLLRRINRELDCDFDPGSFRHHAFYDHEKSRVEMHLISDRDQAVHLSGHTISFAAGESIWTESSYKYDLKDFERIASRAGFNVEHVWTDERQWFSVQYLVCR
jgi:dimethylhistidine N-methyltransferase